MEVVDTFIKKMHEVLKNKKSNTFNPRILPLIKEFPFVCGLDIEFTLKNKKFIHESWEFAEMILTQFPLIPLETTTLSEIFQVLAIVGSFQGDIPYSPNYQSIVNILLQNIAEDNNTHSQLSALTTLFMFPTFVNSYFFSDYFIDSLKKIFSTEELSIAFEHFTRLFSSLVKFNSPNIPKSINIITFIINSLQEKNIKSINEPHAALFMAALVQKVSFNTDILNKFVSLDGPSVGYNAVKDKSLYIKPYFKQLIKAANGADKIVPNILISGYIINLLKSETIETQKQLLLTLIDIARDTTASMDRLSTVFDFTELLSINSASEPKIQELLVTFVGALIDRNYLFYSDLLTDLFLIDLSDESIKRLSLILSKMNYSHLNQNSKKSMLIFFLEKKSTGESGKILCEYSSFRDLYRYLYETEKSSRETMLKRAIHMELSFQSNDTFIDFIVNLIQIDTNEDMLKLYSKHLYENFSPSLFQVLISYLKTNDENVSLFLNIDGFRLLDDVFKQKEISDDMIAEMLNAISSQKFRKDLNQIILNLHPSHRFFNLSPDSYRKIFFHKECKYPIRLPVLLPFLDFPPIPTQIDLVNEAIYAVPIYIRNSKIPPHTSKIASRYIPIEYAKNIIENYQPDLIYQERNDNFPLYEFVKGNKKSYISVNVPFFGIAFWFKCSYRYHEELTVFDAKSVKILITENILSIIWGNESRKVEIDRGWHFVFVQNSASTFESSVNVILDGVEYNFDEQCLLNAFTFGDPEKVPDETWVLSSNIRIFDSLFSDLKHVAELQKKGPGYIETTKHDEFIGTFTQGFRMNDGVYFVPFNDLASAIKIPEILSSFFRRMANAESTDVLDVLIEKGMILNLDKEPIPNFWYYLINVLKKRADIATPRTYFNICNYIIKKMTTSDFIDIARSIFLDVELWSLHSYDEISKLLNFIIKFLEKDEMKSFIIPQGWISFFISMGIRAKDYQTQNIFFDFVLNLSVHHNLQEPLLVLSYLAFFGEKLEDISIFPEFLCSYLKFVTKNPESVIFIPSTWFIDQLEISQDLDICINLIKAICALRQKSISFDMPIAASLVKFTESKEFWNDLILLFDNQFKNTLPFLLSQLLQYTAISIFAQSTGQQCLVNDEIVQNGFKFLNEIISSKPELFTNEDTINTVSLFSPIVAGIIHPDELHAFMNSTDLTAVSSDSTKVNTDFITKTLNKIWCIDQKYEKENQKEKEKSFSLGENILSRIMFEAQRIGIDTEKPPVHSSSSLLAKLGFTQFIYSLISVNAQNSLTHRLLRTAILFQPLPAHIINIKAVSEILISFLKLQIKLSKENTLKFIQCLILAIERNTFDKYMVSIAPFIIEFLTFNQFDDLEEDLITLLCMLSEGVFTTSSDAFVESIKKGKELLSDQKFAQTNFALSILIPLIETMNNNDISEFVSAVYQNILTSESFTKRITEKITGKPEDTNSFLEYFDKYSKKEEEISFPESIVSKVLYMLDQSKSERISTKHDDSGNSDYRTLTKYLMSNQFSKEMLPEVLSQRPSRVLKELVKLTEIISLRQCECFAISVWQSENIPNIFSKLSQEETNSIVPVGISIAPIVNIQFDSAEKCQEAEDLCQKLRLETQNKNSLFIDYKNTFFSNPSKYASSCTDSPNTLLQSFVKRFYKFGDFKGLCGGSITYNDEAVPASLLFFSPGIFVLLHSDVCDGGIALKEVNSMNVVNASIRGEFGNTTAFCGRPVLMMNPYDIAHFIQNESVFEIYPLYLNAFKISALNSKMLADALSIGSGFLKKQLKSDFVSLFDNSECERRWANYEISNADLLRCLSRNERIVPAISPVEYSGGVFPASQINAMEDSEFITFVRNRFPFFGRKKPRTGRAPHKSFAAARKHSVAVVLEGRPMTVRPEISDAVALSAPAGVVCVRLGAGGSALFRLFGRSSLVPLCRRID